MTARKELQKNRVYVGQFEDIGFGENSFDGITMIHVIEYLPDPQNTIRECCRILKPEGTLVVITPNSGSLGRKISK